MLDGGKRGRLDGPPKDLTPASRPVPPSPARSRGAGATPPSFGAPPEYEAHAGPHRHQTAESGSAAATQVEPERRAASAPPAAGQFDLNRPTLIALFYIGSVAFGPLAFVGAVLSYISRGEPRQPWEASHYRYLIRTFWTGFIGILVSLPLFAIFIGVFTLLGVIGLVIARSVNVINRAQRSEPMPDPDAWLV